MIATLILTVTMVIEALHRSINKMYINGEIDYNKPDEQIIKFWQDYLPDIPDVIRTAEYLVTQNPQYLHGTTQKKGNEQIYFFCKNLVRFKHLVREDDNQEAQITLWDIVSRLKDSIVKDHVMFHENHPTLSRQQVLDLVFHFMHEEDYKHKIESALEIFSQMRQDHIAEWIKKEENWILHHTRAKTFSVLMNILKPSTDLQIQMIHSFSFFDNTVEDLVSAFPTIYKALESGEANEFTDSFVSDEIWPLLIAEKGNSLDRLYSEPAWIRWNIVQKQLDVETVSTKTCFMIVSLLLGTQQELNFFKDEEITLPSAKLEKLEEEAFLVLQGSIHQFESTFTSKVFQEYNSD